MTTLEQAQARKVTSPWVRRAEEAVEAARSGRHATVAAEPTLGDSIRADIRLDDRERELQDAYILGQEVAQARMEGR